MRTGTLFHESIQVAEDLCLSCPHSENLANILYFHFYIIARVYVVPGYLVRCKITC